jgi:hypothetical protein
MLSLKLLDEHIRACREYVAAGKETEGTLHFLMALRKDMEHASAADWQIYNDLAKHMPADDADAALIILKGQLLIEGLVKKFVASRLPNFKALERHRFTAAQYIAIGESMCLDNQEPRWLWKQISELNAIRNDVAHSLDGEKVAKRINNFISTVSNARQLKTRTLSAVIARLFGMMKGLCDLSMSDEFKN